MRGGERVFRPPVTTADVVWTFSGVRPLYDDGASAASAATRDYVLELDDDGPPLVSIFGGKITTYRRLAEHVLDKLEPTLPLIALRRGWTAAAPLPGGAFPATEVEARVEALRLRYPFLGDGEARRLTRAYGLRASEILGEASERRALGRDFGAGLSEREVDYLMRVEWAESAEDVAWRRTKLGLRFSADEIAALDRFIAGRLAEGGRRVERAKDAGVILVIDQGTTSTRSIVFGLDAAPVASAQAEFQQLYPRPGWVEHDPETLWRTTLSTAREALRRAACEARDLAAIGIANQRETALIWERATGKPIANAIVWQDRRTAEACAGLKAEGAEPQVTAATGLVIDPYFSATKIAWLLDNVAGARAAAERGELAFGTVDTFLLWRLTNGAVHATDATNASRTLLYDIRKGAWDDDMLRLFRVPRALLPEVMDTAAEYGASAPEHLGGSVPIRALDRRSAERADRPGLRSSPAWSRRPTAPAASCCSTPARRPRRRAIAC